MTEAILDLQVNGTQVETKTVIDNRVRLVVDGRQVDSWELAVLESAKISEWLMLFCFYLENASGKISPELVKKPLDELTAKEIETIKASRAYKTIKHFKLAQLKSIVESFSTQATADF